MLVVSHEKEDKAAVHTRTQHGIAPFAIKVLVGLTSGVLFYAYLLHQTLSSVFVSRQFAIN